jgi:hypothetical protein
MTSPNDISIDTLDSVPWRSFDTLDCSGLVVRGALERMLAIDEDDDPDDEDIVAELENLKYNLSTQDTWLTQAAAAALPYMLLAAQNPALRVRVALLAFAHELVSRARQDRTMELADNDPDLAADQERLRTWSEQLVQAVDGQQRRISALLQDSDPQVRTYAALLRGEGARRPRP